jgi:hypothetical protein
MLAADKGCSGRLVALLRAPKTADALLVVDRLIFGPPWASRFSICAEGEL